MGADTDTFSTLTWFRGRSSWGPAPHSCHRTGTSPPAISCADVRTLQTYAAARPLGLCRVPILHMHGSLHDSVNRASEYPCPWGRIFAALFVRRAHALAEVYMPVVFDVTPYPNMGYEAPPRCRRVRAVDAARTEAVALDAGCDAIHQRAVARRLPGLRAHVHILRLLLPLLEGAPARGSVPWIVLVHHEPQADCELVPLLNVLLPSHIWVVDMVQRPPHRQRF